MKKLQDPRLTVPGISLAFIRKELRPCRFKKKTDQLSFAGKRRRKEKRCNLCKLCHGLRKVYIQI